MPNRLYSHVRQIAAAMAHQAVHVRKCTVTHAHAHAILSDTHTFASLIASSPVTDDCTTRRGIRVRNGHASQAELMLDE